MISMTSTPTHIITITGYGSDGEGVARLSDGRVVFVRNAARGDVLEVKLTKEKPRSAHAEIVRILEPSPYRIEPDCPAYPECGGCNFRHIIYKEELELKLRRVNDTLERIGGLSAHASEILRTEQIDGYRNKAVFHTDGKVLGFFQSHSHAIVPIERCLLLKEDLNDAIMQLSQCIKATKDSEVTQSLTHSRKIIQDILPHEEITQSQSQICNVTQNLLPGGQITLRSGWNGLGKQLEEKIDDLVFSISGFFQVNTGAALLLYQKAREYAAMAENETLIDLYCGVGSLTLFVGRDAGYVFGVEQNPDAVRVARENARRNNLTHVEFISADVAKWEPKGLSPDCVIVDPPRAGLSPEAVKKLLTLSAKRIVYVSCDPATLARDLRILKGYTIKDICAVDMFPRTANVECCCLLATC